MCYPCEDITICDDIGAHAPKGDPPFTMGVGETGDGGFGGGIVGLAADVAVKVQMYWRDSALIVARTVRKRG
jgi:hypothetical protein